MYRAISRDVKIAAIQPAERQLLPLKDILLCCGFSRRTFYRILKLWRETGDVINNLPVQRGGPRTLHHTDIHYLLQLIQQNPNYFLDKILKMLRMIFFQSPNNYKPREFFLSPNYLLQPLLYPFQPPFNPLPSLQLLLVYLHHLLFSLPVSAT